MTARSPLVIASGQLQQLQAGDGLAAIPFAQIPTPTSPPAAGYLFVYAKADGNLYKMDSSGTESPLSTGSGGGAPSGSAVIIDALPQVKISGLADTNAAPTEVFNAVITATLSDTNAAPTEVFIAKIGGMSDVNSAPTEALKARFAYAGNTTFTAPVTGTYTFELWGGGQGGAAGSAVSGGNGGYSGDYVTATVFLTAGQTVTITIGAASATAGLGNDTTIVVTGGTTLRAKGGGNASTSIGGTITPGNPGATGALLAAGGKGGDAPGGGGTGGNGNTGAGSPGNPPGGGGGGGGGSLTSPGAGSAGARGEVRITIQYV